MLFDKALRHFTTAGTLKLADAGGRVFAFEGGPGPRFAVRLTDPSLNRKFLVNPWLSIGEAYTDGTLVIEEGRLGDLLEYLCRNGRSHEHNPVLALSRWIDQRTRRLQQFNTLRRSHRNVAHHYDLSADLYRLFLGNDLQYSCGYFTSPDDTLEQAQHNKQRHIAAKLLLRPGHRVLDIGSGWGGLCLYLAQLTDIQLTGVTLSSEQYEIAALRARKAGLTDRVRFCLHDYRDEHGPYDRIVSVGMFEHVGATHYRQFFAKLRELLADDGICLLHSIFRMDPPSNTNAWMRKYIFPGGYTPSLSEVLAALEHEQLYVTDIEILRVHYAETLRHWYDRFQVNREQAAEIYDERFCRMWEWYLKSCEMAFRHWNQAVFQMQISKRQDAVPLTRDYITDGERSEAARDKTKPEIAA